MCRFDTNAEEAACIYVKFFYVLTYISRQVSNNFSLVFTHSHRHTHARTACGNSQTAVCFFKLTIFT
jgi:hypothetical protein